MKSRGYTLFEVVVVLAILCVLASVLLPALSLGKTKAKETVCISNLRQLGMAMQMYREDQGVYPGRSNPALNQYLGSAVLRCPMLPAKALGNLSAYQNLGIYSTSYTNSFEQAYANALKTCADTRGGSYPVLLDRHHLPKILRPDDQIYGVALVFREAGSVDRIMRSKVAQILLATNGMAPLSVLPCSPKAKDANF